MGERPRYISKAEYLAQLKEASPEDLGRMLVHFDEMRLYAGAVSAFFGALALASATANYLSENEIVDKLALAGGVITTVLSMLTSPGVIKANREGRVIVGEIQSRGLEVPRRLIRRNRN